MSEETGAATETPPAETPPAETPPTTPPTTPDPAAVAAAQAKAAEEAETAKKAEDAAKAKEAETGKAEEKGKEEPRTFTADDIKLPEGAEIDEGLRDGFLEVANKHQFTEEQVSDLVNLQANAMKEASEKGSQLWADTQEKWQAEASADKEIGGQALEQNLANISKLIDSVGGDKADELRSAFDFTGFGNHPAAIRFLSKIANEFVEGKFAIGGPGSGERTQAQTMYPNQEKS